MSQLLKRVVRIGGVLNWKLFRCFATLLRFGHDRVHTAASLTCTVVDGHGLDVDIGHCDTLLSTLV